MRQNKLVAAGERDRAGTRYMRFTKTTLESVKCPAGKDRVYIFDEVQPGLAYCLTATGSASFYLVKRVGGRPVRFRLADASVGVEQARKLAAMKLAAVAEGRDIQVERQAERRRTTFASLWADFKAIEGPKIKTIDQYEDNYDRYLTPLANRPIDSITRGDVARLHASIGAKNGHYAANRALALVSRLMKWAEAQHGVPNPVKGIQRFAEQSRERFIQPGELDAFRKAIDSEPDPLWKDYWTMMLETGQRRSNVSSMAWADIDLSAAVWRVSATSSKSGKAFTIPLSTAAMKVLKARHRDYGNQPWVFPSYSLSGHVTEPKGAWKRLLERAGLTDLRLHDVRRTVGSYAAMSGVAMPGVASLLGQSTTHATAVYSRFASDAVRAAGDAARAAMDAAAKAASKRPRKSAKD